MRGHILVIEDEYYVYEDLQFGLGQAHNLHYADNLAKVNKFFRDYPIDLAFVDLNFQANQQERLSGLKYIKTLRLRHPSLTIVVLSQFSDTDRIVRATQHGADYYLIKSNLDTDSDEFRERVRQWINQKKRLDKDREQGAADAWGKAEVEEGTHEKCLEYAESQTHFLLEGEPGLGKHFLLDRMYRKSRYFRVHKTPLTVDLSLHSPQELHGYLHLERGSGKDNFLRQSPIPLLFLRNLDQHPLSIQELFLQLITEQRFIGKEDRLNLQLVFVLETSPQSLIAQQKLSPELVHFLPVLRLVPLRERVEELEVIVGHWQSLHGYADVSFSPQSLLALRRYPFPGNITELYALLDQSLQNHKKAFPTNWQKKNVRPESLPDIIMQTPSHLYEEMQLEVARIHLRFVEQALKMFEGERRQKDLAAHELQVHSADNLKKTYINKYWEAYPELVKGFPTIMKKYKLDER